MKPIPNKGELSMSSLVETRLECNSRLKLNFDGGDLSSNAGLFLIKELLHKIGFDKVITTYKSVILLTF